LMRTWSDDFEYLYQLGSNIYTYIFQTNPKAKQLFPFMEKYGDRWKESKEFRSQALKFVQVLSLAVKNVYHMERLAPLLYNIGEKHVQFIDRGFIPEFWDTFLDAMEISLEAHIKSLNDFNEKQRNDAIRTWRTLALYIITHMKFGFIDGLETRRKSKLKI
uniref:GLOBIN domain-containing protein n=1 Tax=Dracunculus medinensis TaxID=318479 RepID=A0A0N4U5K5_DRAME